MPAVYSYERCAGCDGRLGQEYRIALGRRWHDCCLVCKGCYKPLGDASFVKKDGKPYHEACYMRAFGERCTGCGLIIDGRYIRNESGDKYHEKCFPAKENWSPKENRRCAGCSGRIGREHTIALGAAWHPGCFRCTGCFEPLDDAKFVVKDGQPYHDACYMKAHGDKCTGCGLFIRGKYLTALESGSKYHPECFTCAACGEGVQHSYINVNGAPYCTAHAPAARRACLRDQAPHTGAPAPSGPPFGGPARCRQHVSAPIPALSLPQLNV